MTTDLSTSGEILSPLKQGKMELNVRFKSSSQDQIITKMLNEVRYQLLTDYNCIVKLV